MIQSFVLTAGLIGACFLAVYQIAQGKRTTGSFVVLVVYYSELTSMFEYDGK